MFKNIVVFFTVLTFSLSSFAVCDFKTIKETPDGYLYNKECHIKVGEMKRDLDISKNQIANLTKGLTLKDVALEKADERTRLWQESTFKLEDRINTIDKWRSSNNTLYFWSGVGLTVLSIYAASAVIKASD